jgi:DNA-binding LytR/AlgR family response regulator
MIKCVAIDDEPLALEVLKKYISKTTELQLEAMFSNALEGQEYLKKNKVDLLLLDIRMPGINGIQLFKSLIEKPMVIFTTAYKEFAMDGFEAEAIDYLLKPFDLERFQKGVTKAVLWHKLKIENNDQQKEFLHFHSEYKVIKIAHREIIYIEASDDYAKINTNDQPYLTLLSMKALFEKLPKNLFIRIHRSYIVAINQIAFVQFRKIGLINGIELPIGDTYRKEIAKLKKA